MEKFRNPEQPFRCVITGLSECGKSYFLTNSILNKNIEFEIMYNFSPSLHQTSYQKVIKGISYYIPKEIITVKRNEQEENKKFDEIINDEDFEKSETEIEAFVSIGEIKYPQEYDSYQPIVIILDDLSRKEINYLPVQAMFKRSTLISISIFVITQDSYKLPERTITANGNIYHIFKANNFREVRNLYQDKVSSDMTLNEYKSLTSI